MAVKADSRDRSRSLCANAGAAKAAEAELEQAIERNCCLTAESLSTSPAISGAGGP